MMDFLQSFGAKYLLRFDDICSSMNWETWEKVERILTERSLKPILAVVPKNVDPNLEAAPARVDFWERARHWEKLGWEIAVHGYEHRFVTEDPGILGLNRYSEFAGLASELQDTKLAASLRIFKSEGITPRTWVAPAHSFDAATVALLPKHGLTVISDGFGLFPRREPNGVTWVPQQLWRLRRFPMGTWTVCHHVNRWRMRELETFERQVDLFRGQIVSLDELLALKLPELGPANRAFEKLYGRLVVRKRNQGQRARAGEQSL